MILVVQLKIQIVVSENKKRNAIPWGNVRAGASIFVTGGGGDVTVLGTGC